MKYKDFFLASIFVFLLSSCKDNESNNNNNLNNNEKKEIISNEEELKNILGTWNWRSEDKSEEFTIKIKNIVNDSVFGQYCAVTDNGNKLDCDFDDINNIKGIIVKDKIYLNFNSFFGAKNGQAEIKISQNYIEWKITKSPIGEYYSPKSVTLHKKEHKNESKSNEINEIGLSNVSLIYDEKIDINKVKYNILDDKIKGAEKFLCEEKEIRYIQLPKKGNVNLILVPQDCADFNYRFYLLTILNDKVISNQYVEGEWYEPDDDSYKEIKSFIINENYIITVTTNSIENGKTSLKEKLNYEISDKGVLKKI